MRCISIETSKETEDPEGVAVSDVVVNERVNRNCQLPSSLAALAHLTSRGSFEFCLAFRVGGKEPGRRKDGLFRNRK